MVLSRLRRHRWIWASISLAAVLAHLGIWWWFRSNRIQAAAVLAYFLSALTATAFFLLAFSLVVFPPGSQSPRPPMTRVLLMIGKAAWCLGLVGLVIQAVLLERQAVRFFYARFALRLF